MQVDDGLERQAKLTVWSHPGDDVTGMVSRSDKVAGTCQEVSSYLVKRNALKNLL